MFANTNSTGVGGSATEAVKSVYERKPTEAGGSALATDGGCSWAGHAGSDNNSDGYDQLNSTPLAKEVRVATIAAP